MLAFTALEPIIKEYNNVTRNLELIVGLMEVYQ
jgi:hypothetical protein